MEEEEEELDLPGVWSSLATGKFWEKGERRTGSARQAEMEGNPPLLRAACCCFCFCCPACLPAWPGERFREGEEGGK